VLADEPTANLDSVTGTNILNLMKELNQSEKTTFIFSTHDARVGPTPARWCAWLTAIKIACRPRRRCARADCPREGRPDARVPRHAQVIAQIALRNLFASSAQTLIVGGIILFGSLLVVVAQPWWTAWMPP